MRCGRSHSRKRDSVCTRSGCSLRSIRETEGTDYSVCTCTRTDMVVLHTHLGGAVQSRGGLIEQQHVRVPNESAGNGDTLSLAPRELAAPLSDLRVVACSGREECIERTYQGLSCAWRKRASTTPRKEIAAHAHHGIMRPKLFGAVRLLLTGSPAKTVTSTHAK